ncbi:uncharacterized protein LOC119654102 [Hermetia illucens]|nr:uncharacterized protein LOC119654102 [Hermetia illucens]
MLSFGDKFMKQKDGDKTKNENSMHKFVEDFSRDIANSSFPTIDLALPLVNVPQKVQTGGFFQSKPKSSSLTLNNLSRKRATSPLKQERKQPQAANGNSSKDSSFSFLPALQLNNVAKKMQGPTSGSVGHGGQSKDRPESSRERSNPRKDVNRDLILITGNVHFAIKMNKLYADSNLLYEVYGKVLRTLQGKFPCEQIVFLRNESGPVLQVVFYEIDAQLPNIESGCNVRCIGKFKGASRLHSFKITPLPSPPKEESLSRLKNLCNFTMNKIKGKDK